MAARTPPPPPTHTPPARSRRAGLRLRPSRFRSILEPVRPQLSPSAAPQLGAAEPSLLGPQLFFRAARFDGVPVPVGQTGRGTGLLASTRSPEPENFLPPQDALSRFHRPRFPTWVGAPELRATLRSPALTVL